MVNWWFGAWWFGFLGIVMKRAPLKSQATIQNHQFAMWPTLIVTNITAENWWEGKMIHLRDTILSDANLLLSGSVAYPTLAKGNISSKHASCGKEIWESFWFESFKLGGGFEHLLFSPRKFLEDEPHFDSWVGSTTNKRLLLYSPLPSLGCLPPNFCGRDGQVGSSSQASVVYLEEALGLVNLWLAGEPWSVVGSGWVVWLGRVGLTWCPRRRRRSGILFEPKVFKRQLLGECHARILWCQTCLRDLLIRYNTCACDRTIVL